MQPLTQAAQLFETIERIKRGAAEFTTNFFAGRGQVQAWLDRGVLSYTEGVRSSLIFRRDHDFHHVYHVAGGPQELSGALGSLDSDPAGPRTVLTADLVGPAGETESVAGIYRQRGYGDYTSLVRMVRIVDGSLPDYPENPSVVCAEAADVPILRAFLEGVLDRFRDQIPETEKIAAAVARRNVLIERRGQVLGGVLFFETTGLTSHLRYWYVDRRFHDQGIGGRLIKTYFRACRASRRIVLWVVDDNADAIAKYRHYGFRKEDLVDRIMMRRRNS